MKFDRVELPIATQMIDLSNRAPHVFQKYFCLWAAFNNIYVQVGKRNGLNVNFRRNDGEVEFKPPDKYGYTFPKVSTPKEYEQIECAINNMAENTKEVLVRHPSVEFFVNRIPRDCEGNREAYNQPINGVLNLTRTVDNDHPVWSPVNPDKYNQYLNGSEEFLGELTEQVVFLLYTIRNNLFHGGKMPGEANDEEVVTNAIPLLSIVVCSFIHGFEFDENRKICRFH